MNIPPIRCLITAGPTREHLDPIRYLSNPSSGKMGYALAEAAIALGWEVDLVSGPVSLASPKGIRKVEVTSGQEMLDACLELFPHCDVLVMCAAVCDMRPQLAHNHKIKKEAFDWVVRFEPVPDILKTLSLRRIPGQTLVGFAAETHDVEAYARRKLLEKDLDWIVANDVSQTGAGFGVDTNIVTLYGRDGAVHALSPSTKKKVARAILKQVDPARTRS